nr:MAG TPA: restriction alleviation protein [Caudoviricetes sp.]
MEALRPCPFCAATPFVEGNGGIFRVVCPNGDCYMHASEIYFGTEEEARAAWNTRMTPDGMDKVFRKSDAVEAFCAAFDEDIADGMDAINAFPCGRATAIIGGLPPVGEVLKRAKE